jgi:hypothetical protein
MCLPFSGKVMKLFINDKRPTNTGVYWSAFCIKSQCWKHHIAYQYRGILVDGSDAFILLYAFESEMLLLVHQGIIIYFILLDAFYFLLSSCWAANTRNM